MIRPIIHRLSSEQYHHGEEESRYLSSSQLKWYAKSPRYARLRLDNPEDETEKSDALRLGDLFHSMMQWCAHKESSEFEKKILGWVGFRLAVFEPPVNEKTGKPYGVLSNVFKEAYEEFNSRHRTDSVVTAEVRDTLLAMGRSLILGNGATSAQVRNLLKWARAAEVSCFYETEDGIRLKVRPDLLTRDKIVDWKTCSLDSLDEESIARQIIKYRYDVSLSMYQHVLHEIGGKWYTPILVFVQKQPPFDAVMCDISEWCYSYDEAGDYVNPGVGALEFRRLLDLHTECVKKNEWPGAESAIEADGNVRVMRPGVPAWFGYRYFGM